MKPLVIWFVLGWGLLGLGEAQAMFIRIQTKLVPIGRVLKNLNERLAKDTNDVTTLYQLARVYSMAYSTNLTTVPIRTDEFEPVFRYPGYDNGLPDMVVHPANAKARAVARQYLTNAIGYYQRAAAAVMTGTNRTANEWLGPPIHLGLAWCIDESGQHEKAVRAYRDALQLAWKMEVEPSFKEQLDWSWDQVRAKKNPLTRPTKSLGVGVCYSDEIIGYLLKLLDPGKDAKEIIQLQKDRLKLRAMPRLITPILVSLEPNTPLAELVNPTADVAFDLDGSGFERRWGWITPKAAWLVFDPDGSGRITSGLQLFGNVTFWIFWRNGYDALSSLDDNGDGVLTGDELRGISLWRDINGNGICDPGEVRPVADWGIVALECRGREHATGISFHPRGAVFKNGATRATYDWIAPASPAGAAAGIAGGEPGWDTNDIPQKAVERSGAKSY